MVGSQGAWPPNSGALACATCTPAFGRRASLGQISAKLAHRRYLRAIWRLIGTLCSHSPPSGSNSSHRNRGLQVLSENFHHALVPDTDQLIYSHLNHTLYSAPWNEVIADL